MGNLNVHKIQNVPGDPGQALDGARRSNAGHGTAWMGAIGPNARVILMALTAFGKICPEALLM